MMARERFREEFKQEAVRQVVEWGYAASDVAKRLGICVQSLYTWLKAKHPGADDKAKLELAEVRRETLRLRAALARTQEERDILKKAAAYFASHPE
jgi:transposase